MENLTVYKIHSVTDREDNPKEHIEDINTLYHIHVAIIGRTALLVHAKNDNKCVRTSIVQDIQLYNNLIRIETMNTIYKLEAVTKGE